MNDSQGSHHARRHWALAALTLTLRVVTTLSLEVSCGGVKVVVVGGGGGHVAVEGGECQEGVDDVISTQTLQRRVQRSYRRPITCSIKSNQIKFIKAEGPLWSLTLPKA